jgi:hypothetical protein
VGKIGKKGDQARPPYFYLSAIIPAVDPFLLDGANGNPGMVYGIGAVPVFVNYIVRKIFLS